MLKRLITPVFVLLGIVVLPSTVQVTAVLAAEANLKFMMADADPWQ